MSWTKAAISAIKKIQDLPDDEKPVERIIVTDIQEKGHVGKIANTIYMNHQDFCELCEHLKRDWKTYFNSTEKLYGINILFMLGYVPGMPDNLFYLREIPKIWITERGI